MSTLYKYDLRKGDVFVLIWERVRRVRRQSFSSELLISGGGGRNVLLLPLVVIDAYGTIYIYIWRFFLNVCCRDCVGVCGNVCCVAAVVEDSVLELECLSMFMFV